VRTAAQVQRTFDVFTNNGTQTKIATVTVPAGASGVLTNVTTAIAAFPLAIAANTVIEVINGPEALFDVVSVTIKGKRVLP
jgi:hypothetical protein